MNSLTPTRIIVRADDAGSSVEANLGILDTIEQGIVRNVSVLAVGPALHHAAETLAKCKDTAFGLHAAITSEWDDVRWGPVLPSALVMSLVLPDGTFPRSPHDLQQRGFSLNELEHEILAQLEKLRMAGFRVSYLDTHMGFDWLPNVAEQLQKICAAEGLVYDEKQTHPRLPGSGAPLTERIASVSGGRWVLITHPYRASQGCDAFHSKDYPPGTVARARDTERLQLCDASLLKGIKNGEIILERYA